MSNNPRWSRKSNFAQRQPDWTSDPDEVGLFSGDVISQDVRGRVERLGGWRGVSNQIITLTADEVGRREMVWSCHEAVVSGHRTYSDSSD